MKSTLLFMFAVLGLASLKAQPLTFEITGIQKTKGEILVSIFSQPEGFPFDTGKAIKLLKGTATNGQVTFKVDALPAGEYAIACFHDSNGDGILNTNLLGIPKEGYGVSNNAFNTFSAPHFEESSFKHSQQTHLQFKMKY